MSTMPDDEGPRAAADSHPCDLRRTCSGRCRCSCGPCRASAELDAALDRIAEGRSHPMPCAVPSCPWHSAEVVDV